MDGLDEEKTKKKKSGQDSVRCGCNRDKRPSLSLLFFIVFYTTGHLGERRHQVGGNLHSVNGQRPGQGNDASAQNGSTLPRQS